MDNRLNWTVALLLSGAAVAGCEGSPLRNFITGNKPAQATPVPAPTQPAPEDIASPTVSPAEPVPADINLQPVTKFGEDIEIPTGFPDDIPVYKNARVTTTEVNEHKKAFSLQLTTTDPIEDVFVYYELAFPAKGWSVVRELTDLQDSDLRMMGYSKDARTASVTLIRSLDTTLIHISTMPSSPP